MAPQQVHRPGPLKQQNKAHKHGKHRSKGELDAMNKGRTSLKESTKKRRNEISRKNKRRQATLLRDKKREEILNQKRGLGIEGSAPILIVVIPIKPAISGEDFVTPMKSCDPNCKIYENETGFLHISFPRFKQRFTFVLPDMDNVDAVLDAAKVADTLVFLYPQNCEEENMYDNAIITTLFAQGLPSSVHVMISDTVINPKSKKNLLKNIQKRFPEEKLNVLSKPDDCFLILRQISCQKQRHVVYRDRRGYIMAENLSMDTNEKKGTLKLYGYVRSKPIDVNCLIHITGWGDFQMEKIEVLSDPLTTKKISMESDGSIVERVINSDPELQESLQSENVPNPMDGEQTFPTEEEMKEAEEEFLETKKKKKNVARVPKGTSKYQAAWLVDENIEDYVEEDDDENDEKDDDVEMDASEGDSEDEKESENDCEEFEELPVADENVEYDEDLNLDQEREDLNHFRVTWQDEDNPDEIEYPENVEARVRFQKYRGLKSFRTSPWDPKENLPADYARVFQFQNFNCTKKRILKEERSGETVVQPGFFVCIHVANVPRRFIETHEFKKPVIAFQLLSHEQKMSVVHLTLKKQLHGANIKSKDNLLFHVGFRRFSACPIFSQHTAGDKHKFERYLGDDVTVATVFAPITFPPMPVLVFREEEDGDKILIATGSVLSVNPDRIIIKRVILSGHPFKINRKTAVVRHMFFNTEDIDWFKPIELRTKSGRRGHITESLGTHGHMKCTFDGQLKSNERVMLTLYKRVFPKWSYEPSV